MVVMKMTGFVSLSLDFTMFIDTSTSSTHFDFTWLARLNRESKSDRESWLDFTLLADLNILTNKLQLPNSCFFCSSYTITSNKALAYHIIVILE